MKKLVFIGLLACLTACSAVNTIYVTEESVPVTHAYDSVNSVDSIVAPYKKEMEQQMNEVIAYSENDFIKGRPGGALNNWSADAILNDQLSKVQKPDPVFCLLNVGGLRNPIGKGDVTLEAIYKLMPFDNLVVWVKMPVSVLPEIEEYLKKTGGEPIAGAKIAGGKLQLNGLTEDTEYFWIVTSDYLMNGGDKMTFFEKRVAEEYADILMRDAMIEQARIQDTLVWSDEIRIQF